ncbi:MAG: histidinol-phosphate aminotransferase family protein [Chloroflexota bacterium]|nr:histidinol-phosphate aminotransferase family protein [Chloroflexota bacterium]
MVVGPTFGEYARAARVAGCVVHDYRASPIDRFAVDPSAVAALVRATDARVVFVCNPNNPTGVLLPLDAVGALAEAAPDSLIVVDESYRQFVDEPPASTPLLVRGNVVLLRSLTKDYALAGLRLGYALAPPEVALALDRVRPPWNVNAVAQAAGLAAIRDEAHLERARAEARRARGYLAAALADHGWRVMPSAANYLLAEVGEARAARAALLQHRVCVRDCTSFGLPRFVRIGVRSLPECERLVDAFAADDVRAAVGAGDG